MVRGYMWSNEHGTHPTRRVKAKRHEQGVQAPLPAQHVAPVP